MLGEWNCYERDFPAYFATWPEPQDGHPDDYKEHHKLLTRVIRNVVNVSPNSNFFFMPCLHAIVDLFPCPAGMELRVPISVFDKRHLGQDAAKTWEFIVVRFQRKTYRVPEKGKLVVWLDIVTTPGHFAFAVWQSRDGALVAPVFIYDSCVSVKVPTRAIPYSGWQAVWLEISRPPSLGGWNPPPPGHGFFHGVVTQQRDASTCWARCVLAARAIATFFLWRFFVKMPVPGHSGVTEPPQLLIGDDDVDTLAKVWAPFFECAHISENPSFNTKDRLDVVYPHLHGKLTRFPIEFFPLATNSPCFSVGNLPQTVRHFGFSDTAANKIALTLDIVPTKVFTSTAASGVRKPWPAPTPLAERLVAPRLVGESSPITDPTVATLVGNQDFLQTPVRSFFGSQDLCDRVADLGDRLVAARLAGSLGEEKAWTFIGGGRKQLHLDMSGAMMPGPEWQILSYHVPGMAAFLPEVDHKDEAYRRMHETARTMAAAKEMRHWSPEAHIGDDDYILEDVKAAVCVWDPCSGFAGTAHALFGRARRVILSDINPSRVSHFVADALSPETHDKATALCNEPFVVVTSPWFSHLDFLLPLLAASNADISCVQIPSTYLTQGPLPRMDYLDSLLTAGRVLIIASKHPRNPDTNKRALCGAPTSRGPGQRGANAARPGAAGRQRGAARGSGAPTRRGPGQRGANAARPGAAGRQRGAARGSGAPTRRGPGQRGANAARPGAAGRQRGAARGSGAPTRRGPGQRGANAPRPGAAGRQRAAARGSGAPTRRGPGQRGANAARPGAAGRQRGAARGSGAPTRRGPGQRGANAPRPGAAGRQRAAARGSGAPTRRGPGQRGANAPRPGAAGRIILFAKISMYLQII
eukprot:jgi/Tetstr1/448852/TSEL_036078.t1